MRYLLWLSLVGCAGTLDVPAEAVAHNQTGVHALEAGDRHAAEAAFRVSLEYNANFAEARANLGLAALERGDYEEAAAQFEAAISVDAHFAQAWSNLGLARLLQGQVPKAEDALITALGIDPGLVAARVNLARLWFVQSRYREARAQLLRVHVIAPEEPVDGLRAITELCLENLEAAEDLARRAFERDPSDPAATVTIALLEINEGHIEEATRLLRLAATDTFWNAPATRLLEGLQPERRL